MILVFDVDDAAVPAIIAAVPDGSVSFGGEFRTLGGAAAAIQAELRRRAGEPQGSSQLSSAVRG